jgi:hypothetical protein
MKYFKRVAVIVLTILAVFGSAMMAGTMYENLRWWSTRSLIQKETSFYSGELFHSSAVPHVCPEQAMYYRYAKKASNLPTLDDVFQFFTNDTKIQYPQHINALSSFNVYPGTFFCAFECF